MLCAEVKLGIEYRVIAEGMKTATCIPQFLYHLQFSDAQHLARHTDRSVLL